MVHQKTLEEDHRHEDGAPVSDHHAREERIPGTFVARTVRRLSVPIILGWLAITVLVTLAVPTLEQVARDHAVSLGAKDAPSVRAMARIGRVFKE
jgi:RND superfamily putative drug exporter